MPANYAWNSVKHVEGRHSLEYRGKVQVAAYQRDAFGDFGHTMVFVRRDDADPSRKWSATIFDHENRVLASAVHRTRNGADARVMERLGILGYSPTGYGSYDGKSKTAE
jgi:hypothetical protein